MNTENKNMNQEKNEYLGNWWHRNCTLGELLIQYKINEENIENVEHYSDKKYPIDHDSPSEDTSKEAASLSDGEVPDPGNIEPMGEEFGDLTKDLARWVLNYQISRNTSNDLLTILRQNGHFEMPKCTSTLLKIQRQVHTEIKCGGDNIYLGISNGISRVFASNPYLQMDSAIVDLVVNVDGAPLHKSSSTQIWPIICKFANYPPFIISLFCGTKKPDDSEEFLHDYLHEIDVLRQAGFQNGNNVFFINLHACLWCTSKTVLKMCQKPH